MTSYARSSTVTFTHLYVDGADTPLTRLNNTYPTVQIEDPNGPIVASGVATATGTPGEWQWSWTIPAASTLGTGWIARWAMVDVNNNTWDWKESFDVVDQIEQPTGLDRTAGYLTMQGTDERLIWRSTTDPHDIQMTFKDSDGEDVYTKTKADLTYIYADGYHVYYYDTTASTDHNTEGQYLVVWRTQTSASSQYEYETQWMIVAYDIFWYNTPHLKMLIDKLNKSTETPLSYLPIELWQSFDQGIGFINSVHPLTTWSWSNFPTAFYTYWILAAGLFALNSRQLLEIEVSHELAGQTTTLTYDHTSPLGEVIARLESYLWEKMLPAKLAAYRQAAGPGIVGVRPPSLRNYRRVYRIASSSSLVGDFPGLLSTIWPI